MKRLMRKNQFVLTILAVLIAIAGYITLTDNSKLKDSNIDAGADVSKNLEDNVLEENQVGFNDSGIDPASLETALTSGSIADNSLSSGAINITEFMASAKLSREQVRGENKETLMGIINSDTLGDEAKQQAITSMLKLTEISEKENSTETLLHARGFENALVTIIDGQVNVVIPAESISDSEKAQIESIVKQKTDMSIQNIVITLMDSAVK